MDRKSILEAADKCVCGDREQSYGSPERNFDVIAELWSAYLNAKFDTRELNIFGDDVAAMMILMKVGRTASGRFKDDNWIDIAGYAACGGELQSAWKGDS